MGGNEIQKRTSCFERGRKRFPADESSLLVLMCTMMRPRGGQVLGKAQRPVVTCFAISCGAVPAERPA
jgi:hypothetical protein